jgi:hypothetical protein
MSDRAEAAIQMTNARLVGSRRPGSARATTKRAIDLGKERASDRLCSRLRHAPDVGADRAAHGEGVGHARGDDRLARAGDLEKVILRCLRKDPQRRYQRTDSVIQR